MNLILDILFPKKCISCRKEGSYICQDCISNILQADLVCPICKGLAVGGQTHSICKKRFGLDGLWSLGIYQGSLKKAIQKLKYEPSLVRDFAPVLVDIIVKYWVKYQPFLFDLIKGNRGEGWGVTSVPLHWYKQNKRGFNQSKLIGQLLSKKLGLDYCDGLKRVRLSKPQVKLKGSERQQNIKDAFVISPNIPISKYHNILLIDDVWTTGSTLKECCYVLKRSGVKRVWALTLAR